MKKKKKSRSFHRQLCNHMYWIVWTTAALALKPAVSFFKLSHFKFVTRLWSSILLKVRNEDMYSR